MIIRFNGRNYDTSADQDYRIICSIIARTSAAKRQGIQQQIEQAKLVSCRDIVLHRRTSGTNARITDLQHGTFKPPVIDLVGARYTFDGQDFIQLPQGSSIDVIAFKLISSLLYNCRRHQRGLTDEQLPLHRIIIKLKPEFRSHTLEQLQLALVNFERDQHDHFDEYPSDDSDTEGELEFQHKPANIKKQVKQAHRDFDSRAKASRFSSILKKLQHGDWAYHTDQQPSQWRFKDKPRKKAQKTPPTPAAELELRQTIKHPENDPIMRQARADLRNLNNAIRQGSALPRLQTQFVVAQYRGITYSAKHWSKPARIQHRQLDEVGQAQYSLSVLKACGFESFEEYMQARQQQPNLEQRLKQKADRLRHRLLRLRKTGPIQYEGYTFKSLAHCLQFVYTTDYDGFHALVAEHIANDGELKAYLLNAHNPFISTGDFPYHALKYAFGIKFYEDHKDERLFPNWDASGQAQHPHSGKIYLSLHPIAELRSEDGPMHIPGLFTAGDIVVDNVIVPEREHCFPGFLPAQHVVYQFVAKFPSFTDSDYKESYLEKYGLTETDFKLYRDLFNTYPPHSPERKFVMLNLAEYLCSYHEVRLVEVARQKAVAQGKVLVYRNNDGTFSLTPPESAPASNNTDAWKIINGLRADRRLLAPSLPMPKQLRFSPIFFGEAREKLHQHPSSPISSPDTVTQKLAPLFQQEIKQHKDLVTSLKEEFTKRRLSF